ncbi:DUF2336 domain-containing protein [Rhodothalassium salexigens]|uniref:DUF2336 domain-containing protein n=1 Tax=Rhodothalassium salexigens TaxID=1086 RepID=UPI001047F778|nr:DUF2336 domain-containing protein [Rhodothalassium salexigens]MBB4212205.1 hypothetical protein [Rhodothalassium salexigens DSM 2132]
MDDTIERQPTKSEVADLLGQYLTSSALSVDARRRLEDLAWWFVDAPEDTVREIMARHLSQADKLTDRTIDRVIKDPAEAVAGPFIEATTLLSEERWLALIEDLEAHALAAVARRPDISEQMALAVVAKGDERVVASLLANANAPVTDRIHAEVSARFGTSGLALSDPAPAGEGAAASHPAPDRAAVDGAARDADDQTELSALAEPPEAGPDKVADDRASVPPAAQTPSTQTPSGGQSLDEKEKRYNTVSEGQLVDRLIRSGREGLADNIKRLGAGGRLSDEFVLAAAERRDLTICALALAYRAHLSPGKVRTSLKTGDLKVYRTLFERAKVRKELWAPIASALTAAPSPSAG